MIAREDFGTHGCGHKPQEPLWTAAERSDIATGIPYPEMYQTLWKANRTVARLIEALTRFAHIPCEMPSGGHCSMLAEYTGKMCAQCEARTLLDALR